eukprot:5055254-Pyramimonas_sp.AAC.1
MIVDYHDFSGAVVPKNLQAAKENLKILHGVSKTFEDLRISPCPPEKPGTFSGIPEDPPVSGGDHDFTGKRM